MWELKWYRGGWYAARPGEGGTRRVSLRTKDRGAAERALADFNKPKSGSTVAEVYLAYAHDLTHRYKPSSRALDAWKALKPTFANLRPDQVTRETCRLYARQRRNLGRANGTIIKELACLSAALHWQDKDTGARIEMPARPTPKERHLAREEYRRLRRAAKRSGLHLYLFVVLGLATAARKQALLDLTWDRVDWRRRQIRLSRGTGGKGRATVPITRHAGRCLKLAAKMAKSSHVIEYGGKPVGSIKRGFAAACERAGLEGVTPHTLRHTAAVWMAEDGVSMDEIAQYLGHSNPGITYRVYARFSPDHLRRAARALE